MRLSIDKRLAYRIFQLGEHGIFFIAPEEEGWFIISNIPAMNGARCRNMEGHINEITRRYYSRINFGDEDWVFWADSGQTHHGYVVPFTSTYQNEHLFESMQHAVEVEMGTFMEEFGYWIETNSVSTEEMCYPSHNVLGGECVYRIDSQEIQKEKKMMTEKMFLKDVIGDVIYQGFHGYHAHHNINNNYMPHGGTLEYPYWVGVELEVECNNRECFEQLTQIKSNWFYVERDGSLDSDRYGAEIITIKMNPKVAANPNTWALLLECLRAGGATSYENGRCGLHVHISKTALGKDDEERDATVGKLYHLYNNELGAGGYGGDYVRKVMQRSYQDYCRSVVRYMDENKSRYFDFVRHYGVDSVKKETTEKVFKDLSKVDPEDYDRYSAISLVNRDTIEFRQGRGTLVLESFMSKIEFAIRIVEFCRKTSMKNCTRNGFFKYLEKLPKENSLRTILNI